MTHSRTNFRSNKNNLNGQSQGKNNKNQSGGFAGSGDGHIESIRSENDDDEDHRFGVHHAALPTTKPAEKTPKVTTDDDLEIDEDKPEDIEDVDEGLDEDEDEEDEEDEDALNENEDDLGIHKTGHHDLGNTPKENPTALPPTDDEDFESQCMAFLYFILTFTFSTHLVSTSTTNGQQNKKELRDCRSCIPIQ